MLVFTKCIFFKYQTPVAQPLMTNAQPQPGAYASYPVQQYAQGYAPQTAPPPYSQAPALPTKM